MLQITETILGNFLLSSAYLSRCRCDAQVHSSTLVFSPYVYVYVYIYIYIYIHIYIYIIKGSLVRKLPGYGRLSWPAFSPAWQPHHHVNIVYIYICQSSCQPHHHGNHIIIKYSKRSGTREFRLENTLGLETLCFFG